MKKILLVVIFALVSVSCFNDNNDKLTFDFEGTWTLQDVMCFCDFGAAPDFSMHKITFDAEELFVENTGSNEFLANAEGEYTLDGNVLTFSNGNQYTFVVELDKLTLTFVDNPDLADDEVVLVYRRG